MGQEIISKVTSNEFMLVEKGKHWLAGEAGVKIPCVYFLLLLRRPNSTWFMYALKRLMFSRPADIIFKLILHVEPTWPLRSFDHVQLFSLQSL